jgi:mannose-6-phosphate isomerase-like protein (cupin superfamily)
MIEPRIIDLKDAAKENTFFRKVLFTTATSQLVVMSLVPGEEIGTETHDGDQLLYAVKGEGIAVINGVKESFEKGTIVCVPGGTPHNVINKGDEALKLFTIYAPPQHRSGTIHATKADAAAEESRTLEATLA